MGAYASRRAAQQMADDGIASLPKWSKPCPGVGVSFRIKLDMPMCEQIGCHKRARYSTPRGNRCFAHARPDVAHFDPAILAQPNGPADPAAYEASRVEEEWKS